MFLAPDAVSVTCLPGYVLRVQFETGEIRHFDVQEQLFQYECYQRLKNPAFFKKAYVDYGTVAWDEQTDIAPEWLYRESKP